MAPGVATDDPGPGMLTIFAFSGAVLGLKQRVGRRR